MVLAINRGDGSSEERSCKTCLSFDPGTCDTEMAHSRDDHLSCLRFVEQEIVPNR